MRFFVQYKVGGNLLYEEEFDSSDSNFNSDIGRFCNRAGHAVKDYITFEMAEKVRETGKKYNEISVSAEIDVKVYFGDCHDYDNFAGHCDIKLFHELEPAETGLYMSNFVSTDREISNLILSKVQNLFCF